MIHVQLKSKYSLITSACSLDDSVYIYPFLNDTIKRKLRNMQMLTLDWMLCEVTDLQVNLCDDIFHTS